MKKQLYKQISRIGLCTLILLHCTVVLSQSKLSLSEQKEHIGQLKSTARQDPLATQAIEELHNLQKQLQAQKMEALEACLVGLTSFMQGNFKTADRELTKAKRSPYVQGIVEFVLPDPNLLDRIVNECQRYGVMSRCKFCTGFGYECCKNCGGIGRIKCTYNFCGGTGKEGGQILVNRRQRRSLPNFGLPKKPCSECRGSGWQICEVCEGIGIKECKNCHQLADSILQTEDYEIINELSGVLSYLKSGGVDFFLRNFQAPLVFYKPDQNE